MAKLSITTREILHEGPDFILFRGCEAGSAVPILARSTVAAPSEAQSTQLLRHEFALASDLESGWAAKPLRLIDVDGHTALLLEDHGGDPLTRLIGRPLEIAFFLGIAIRLAASVDQVHRRGLIHQALRPENVLVSATGDLRLTGFGRASRLLDKNDTRSILELPVEELAYISPEQTGRMDIRVDTRSDLYSLGIILFEMATGTLPFSAADPMEWVHCHLARRPVSANERVSEIPESVADIIAKLLAKAPDERYQTAAGVEADLLRCQTAWQAYGQIKPFPVGSRDVPNRIAIPERLYGRGSELHRLVAAYDRVLEHGTTEIVLLSGYTGVGKSSLVRDFQRSLGWRPGLFASGKFEQGKRNTPYAPLIQAFQTLVQQILMRNEAEVREWSSALRDALGPHGQILIDLVPELEIVVGSQAPAPDIAAKDEENRLHHVFRRFLSVFAEPNKPLTLFLDDLQWIDPATLRFIELSLGHPDVRNLLVLGAYRDNEVNQSHPLTRAMKVIESSGTPVGQVALAPLSVEDVGRLVTDALHTEPVSTEPLAQLLWEKTGGNPFFTIQFLTVLAEESLLNLDLEKQVWEWDLPKIHAKGFTDNVAELMATKMSSLPPETRAALGQMACLGRNANINTLALVLDIPDHVVDDVLWDATQAGLVSRSGRTYTFIHDRVQEAAYGLIPSSEKAGYHLRIARLFRASLDQTGGEENIFDIVDQFDRGADLIVLRDERDDVAALNLAAGMRAKSSTAYASARSYFSVGRSLLSEDAWQRRYDLIFDLELNWAESEYLSGDLVPAEQRLLELSGRARNVKDRAGVTCLRINLYTTLDRSDQAVAAGVEYLQAVGVDWPSPTTAGDVESEYHNLREKLGSRQVEDLIDLPSMVDPKWRATMDVLTTLASPALFTDENVFRHVVGKMVSLSLEHGNSDGSCLAYVWLGGLLGPHFGNYSEGFAFGKLGLDLTEQRKLDRYSARVYLVFAAHVAPWKLHLPKCRVFMTRALEAAQTNGDLSFVAYSCVHLVTKGLASGDPLDQLQREAEKWLEFANKLQFGLVSGIIAGLLSLVRSLRAEPPKFSPDRGQGQSLIELEDHFRSNPQLALAECWYWVYRQQACFYAGDYAAAHAAALRARGLIWTSRAEFELVEHHFYEALTLAALSDAAEVDHERVQLIGELVDHETKLSLWASVCPENMACRVALVRAELSRLQGRREEAQDYYEEAIQSAHEFGFAQIEGLASELAANFYAEKRFSMIADTYRHKARSCYSHWGASAKVSGLVEQYPSLRDLPDWLGPTTAAFDSFDVGTMLRASQALSSEIVLKTLIETLMRIAIEYAGAERGVLVLLRANEPHIAAEAVAQSGAIEMIEDGRPVSSSEVPVGMIHYAIRRGKSIILDSALDDPLFADDEYVQHRRPQSVLCIPILKQAIVVGVLYLENNLARRAFTLAQSHVLEFLASQAAISLENAYLYADLQRSEAFLAEGQRMSQAGSWGWDVRAGTLTWSDEQYRIFGYERATRPTPDLELFYQRVVPEDREIVQRSLEAATRNDGEFSIEFRIRLPDGTLKFLHGVGRPIWGPQGEVHEYIGTTIDITKRKTSEYALRDAQEDFARATRLAAMGELTALIAHEVSQPLSAIVADAGACLSWLDRETPNVLEAREAAQEIVRNGHRAADTIASIRAMAKKSDPEWANLQLDKVVGEILVLLRSEMRRRDILLETDLLTAQSLVYGNPIQLKQVLVNLIMNSIDAMGEVTDRPKILRMSTSIESASTLLITVADTGVGIDPSKVNRIFDPLFTTKSDGMGMGLSISKSIVELHGGHLWATPREPHGSIFRFTLPTGQG